MRSGLLDFYRGKRVFVTGHTGFKGAWLCLLLAGAGAKVTGYALDPPTEPSLYHIAAVREGMDSRRGDVRDYPALAASFRRAEPEIVFHLAAQPLVLESYRRPLDTLFGQYSRNGSSAGMCSADSRCSFSAQRHHG